MHIEHINISAPGDLLEELKDFYCALFGLVEGFRPTFTRKGFWLYAGENPLVHLTESNEHFQNEEQGFLDHVTFQTTGLKEMIHKLDSLGVSYKTDHLPEIGMTQLFFQDPAGIGLEANFLNETFEQTSDAPPSSMLYH